MSNFISYSHRNTDFVKRLHDAFALRQIDTWVDWHGIQPGESWWEEINTGIGQTQNFIFVISEDALASIVCHMEIAQARERGKRIIPVRLEDVDADAAFEKLKAQPTGDVLDALLGDDNILEMARVNLVTVLQQQWIDFTGNANFDEKFEALAEAVLRDLPFLQAYDRWKVRHTEWDRNSQSTAFLLRDRELKEARTWLNTAQSKDIIPDNVDVPQMEQYISASQKFRQRQQRRNILFTAVLILLSLGLGAGVVASTFQPSDEPAILTEPFNIAIADFNEKRPDGTYVDSIDTGYLNDLIATMVIEGSILPEDVEDIGIAAGYPSITGIEDADRQQQAADIARDYGAQVVVFGYIDASKAGNLSVVPQFYTGQSLSGADELTGNEGFGAPIPLRGGLIDPQTGEVNAPVQSAFIRRFTPRLDALGKFLTGLSFFHVQEYDSALAQMQLSLETEGAWGDDTGQEVVYLWIGTLFNVARREEPPPELNCPPELVSGTVTEMIGCALLAYERANMDETFTRADLGLGNIYTEQALTRAESGDGDRACETFNAGIEAYTNAMADADASPLVKAKSNHSLGRAYQLAHDVGRSGDTMICAAPEQRRFSALGVLHLSKVEQILAELPATSEILELRVRSLYQSGQLFIRENMLDKALDSFSAVIELTTTDDPARLETWQIARWDAHYSRAGIYRGLAMNTEDEDQRMTHWQYALEDVNEILQAYQDCTYTRMAFIEMAQDIGDEAVTVLPDDDSVPLINRYQTLQEAIEDRPDRC
jgi:tetratricopeptide (TPR) repeat protein